MLSDVPANLFLVGEFSRLTHLTAKTLRHYHDVDLLVPAVIDPDTGYRYYTPGQIPQAQLIRRLRDVRMPVPQIRDVMAAPDATTRNTVIAEHLEQLQRELVQTATAVGSLRTMLTDDPHALAVSYRPGVAENALTYTGDVTHAQISAWCSEVFPRLYAAARHFQTWPAGAAGALYSGAWFGGQGASVTALVPVTSMDDVREHQGITATVLQSPAYAVTIHQGPFQDLDRTYGALGRHVHAAGLAGPGPIRENYLISPEDSTDATDLRTEVCWPITHLPQP